MYIYYHNFACTHFSDCPSFSSIYYHNHFNDCSKSQLYTYIYIITNCNVCQLSARLYFPNPSIPNMFECWWFMLFNDTFNNISVILWRSALLVDETTDLSKFTDKLIAPLVSLNSSSYHMLYRVTCWTFQNILKLNIFWNV